MATLELVEPRLSEGRFASLDVLTDEALFAQTGVRIAFTGRAGGVSEGPYAALNLGSHVDDDLAHVERNRTLLADALGAQGMPLLVPNQVHGDTVLAVRAPEEAGAVRARAQEGADGIMVSCAGVSALLCFADCMPVIAVSPSGRFAVVHAGWRGVMAEIAAKAVKMLAAEDAAAEEATDPSQFNVYLGPHIHVECFETSREIRDDFVARFGEACGADARHVDLVQAQRASLARVGVDPARVVDAGVCTVCSNERYFSYRAQQGVCGRHGAFAFRMPGERTG